MNGSAYTPTPYPQFELAWPLAWLFVGVILFLISPFTAIIYMAITVPLSVYFCLCFLVDLAGAWVDHKWGREWWIQDRIRETPCDRHAYSTQDPSCPYWHADDSYHPV